MKKILLILFCWVGLGGFFSETFGQILRIDTTSSVKKGSVMGCLQDSTGYTIPMAHVFLIQGKDTVKLVADLDGRFTYKGISSDTVRLWVSAIGYKTIEEDYIPSQHGACIRVLLQEEIFHVDEVIVKAKRPKYMSFYFMNESSRINDQDTMFFGVCHPDVVDLADKAAGFQTFSGIHPIWIFTTYTKYAKWELEEVERKIIELQRHKISGLSDEQSRIQALQKHMAELQALPDQALKTMAQAKGQTVDEYRKETIQNLKNVSKHLKKVNSEDYIDRMIYSYNEHADFWRARREIALHPKVVAAKQRLKNQAAALMVDGKLHNYTNGHGTFKLLHGIMAVARWKYHPKLKREEFVWGFIDEQVREVIPCQYGWVFSKVLLLRNPFNKFPTNQPSYKYRSWDLDYTPYRDSLGWITVGDFIHPDLMGMIDRENNVMIPLKFFWSKDRHEWIEFFYTPEGDFAPVTVKKEDKLLDGIIDRKGNFTLEPVYETPIFWDKERHCFYTDREQGKEEEKKRIYFNAYGEKINNKK